MIEIAGQIVQQQLQEQSQKTQQTQSAEKQRSFDSYMQQTGQTPDGEKAGVQKTEPTNVSGSEMQRKLDELQADLSSRFNQTKPDQNKINEMMPELLDGKSRLGLLKEAYGKVADTSKVTTDLSGRFTQAEAEYKNVEAIMKSNKNLSPGELLALQARLYQVSQHIEVMSKVVDQMAGGIKTVLNTNV